MKTVTELENELSDWEKCIRFETEEKAIKWYLIAYVETWLELQELAICSVVTDTVTTEYALYWQLN